MTADPHQIDALAARVTTLLQQKLGVRGDSLPVALRRAGYRLPRRIRRDGAALVSAAEQSRNPRLARITDGEGLSRAARRIERYLSGLDPVEARARARALLLAEIGFRVAVVIALLIAVLVWQGLV